MADLQSRQVSGDPMWNPFHGFQHKLCQSIDSNSGSGSPQDQSPCQSLNDKEQTAAKYSRLHSAGQPPSGNPNGPITGSLRKQMSECLRQESSTLPVSFGSLRSSSSEAHQAWGWLEAGDESMPNVVLQGSGLAIGASCQGFEARRHALQRASSLSGHLPSSSPTQRLAEVKAKSMRFLEVKDGRISRLHCMITADNSAGPSWMSGSLASIEDTSRNGTFVNGKRLQKGVRTPLSDSDRISLVLSLSPMVERAVIFRAGDPGLTEKAAEINWSSTLQHKRQENTSPSSGPAEAFRDSSDSHQTLGRQRSEDASSGDYQRTFTSLYTTAESSNAMDLICQICLGPFRDCVALQPCGHSFCAPCLSHHFAAILQEGQPLSCPLRCGAPQKVVINFSARQLVRMQAQQAVTGSDTEEEGLMQTMPYADLASSMEELGITTSDSTHERPAKLSTATSLSTQTDIIELSGQSFHSPEDLPSSDEDDSLSHMSPLCPLWDSLLPLEASGLKLKQVEHTVAGLASGNEDVLMLALERLARLAWNDNEVRRKIISVQGIQILVSLIHTWIAEPTVLCNVCLCLMALVRGDGPSSEANQWSLANGRGVEALVTVMTSWPHNAAAVLSVLLCLIPLALDNAFIQSHVANLAQCHVVNALRTHIHNAEIQAKAMVVLGVLCQGEDIEHDKIRQQQLSLGVTARLASALQEWGSANEEVLWSVLFCLAVLVRDGECPYQPAIRSTVAAGIPIMLEQTLAEYRVEGDNADDMILNAGSYMLSTLRPASALVQQSNNAVWALAPILQPSPIWPWGLR